MKNVAKTLYDIFKDDINNNFLKNYENIIKSIDNYIKKYKGSVIESTNLYNMKNVIIDYENLKLKILDIYIKLKEKYKILVLYNRYNEVW